FAIRYKDVLEAIQIDVEKNGRPRPLRSFDAGIERHFRERAVTATELKRVAADLRPIVDEAHRRPDGTRFANLYLPPLMVTAQHVHDKKIDHAFAIDVRAIDTHGKSGGVAQGQAVYGAELPLAIIDPDAVRREQIVAHVYVRGPVAVQIVKLDRQPPVARRLRQRLSVFIQEKAAIGEGERREMSLAAVEIEDIDLAVFQNVGVRPDDKSHSVCGVARRLAGHFEHDRL